MDDPLMVPTFARLDEYCGAWAMEETRFAAMWRLAAVTDLKAHIEEGAAPLKSALEKVPIANGKQIAIVKLAGVLMKSQASFGGTSTILARREIRAAANDPDVAGILLHIDSPGGTVAGTDDLAHDIRSANRVKPVWAHGEDLVASAAYWIASQTSRITANSKTALIGSIGTIQVIRDFSVAAEKEGIRTLVFATGPLKGLGTPGTKVTDDQIAHVQSLVNATQESFDDAVRKGRGLSAKELAEVRHGGVMTAPEAVERKLIDGIQPVSKTLNELTRSLAEGGKQRAIADTGRAGVACLLPITHRRLPVEGVST